MIGFKLIKFCDYKPLKYLDSNLFAIFSILSYDSLYHKSDLL